MTRTQLYILMTLFAFIGVILAAPQSKESKKEIENIRLHAYMDGYQAAMEGYGPTDSQNQPRYRR